ncbi:NAD(P)H-hydrate dehydratase [candidate division KSB1 bacterium]
MEKVVTAKEMRNIDKRAITEIGIPGVVLMERAGLKVAEVVFNFLEEINGNRVVIFCGKGNNGGDGYVAARELFNKGFDVNVYIFGEKLKIKGDALTNLNIAESIGINIEYITSEEWFIQAFIEGDVIIDALLGTGVSGEIYGTVGKAIELINELSIPVISVDIPSGLNSDTGQFEGNCVEAIKTVTMGLKKRGLVVSPGRGLAGEIIVADIGFGGEVISKEEISLNVPEDFDVLCILPKRRVNCNKTECGKVFILSGSRGMTGAAALTSLSVLRAGAGLAVLGVPESLNAIMEEKLTEVITHPLPETEGISFSIKARGEILERLNWADVFAVGPGLSRNSETLELVLSILPEVSIPTVIDADALFALSGKGEIFSRIKSDVIITPHEGEFSRLMGWKIEEVLRDRIESAKRAASILKVNVLLKGSPTILSKPDGDTFLIGTGNPGMASGGVGDVLTGVIAGLAAQGLSLIDAGITGAYLHGKAGDIAKEEKGEMGLIASDVLEFIPYAIEDVRNIEDN